MSNHLTDNDGDSQMISTANTTILDPHHNLATPSTPPTNRLIPSELSPPDSQGGVTLPPTSMPTVAPSASGANANGKRPLDSLDNLTDAAALPDNATMDEINAAIADSNGVGNPNGFATGSANGVGNGSGKTQTHAASGYSWSRPEDAPGYAWQNRKAQEEANRAWDQGVVAKDRIVGNRYGDIFDMTEREAKLNAQSKAP